MIICESCNNKTKIVFSVDGFKVCGSCEKSILMQNEKPKDKDSYAKKATRLKVEFIM